MRCSYRSFGGGKDGCRQLVLYITKSISHGKPKMASFENHRWLCLRCPLSPSRQASRNSFCARDHANSLPIPCTGGRGGGRDLGLVRSSRSRLSTVHTTTVRSAKLTTFGLVTYKLHATAGRESPGRVGPGAARSRFHNPKAGITRWSRHSMQARRII